MKREDPGNEGEDRCGVEHRWHVQLAENEVKGAQITEVDFARNLRPVEVDGLQDTLKDISKSCDELATEIMMNSRLKFLTTNSSSM